MSIRLRHVVLVTASALASCNRGSSGGEQQQQQGGAPPPAEVGVVTLKTEQVTLQNELAGRTAASLTSDVRPQVSGIVKARNFEEGARVTSGQVLYQIDTAGVPSFSAAATAAPGSGTARAG